jgi:hypothetical protein
MIDTRRIGFGLWSPDREAFLAVMGTLTNPLTHGPLMGEDGPSACLIVDEIGPVTKVPGAYDEDGEEIASPLIIEGHHVNLYAVGDLAGLLTAGMPEEGGVFEHTHILDLLGDMDWQPSAIGEPPGYVGTSGVKIYDLDEISVPARVMA